MQLPNTDLSQTPMMLSKPKDLGDELPNPRDYKNIVGKLVYLTCTCPNISYSVIYLSQHTAKPFSSHMKIAIRVLRYLKKSPGLGLYLKSDGSMIDQLSSFSNSDWASCPTMRRDSASSLGRT